MPTKPRIDFAGFHHIVNRGVNRTNVFNHPNDKDMFLQIINKSS
jgi:putative transposase